jgi:hypothetical protein
MTRDPRRRVLEHIGYDDYRGKPGRVSWRKVAILAAIAFAVFLGKALAQVPQTRPYCDEPKAAAKALRDTFGELPAAIALDTQDRLVTLYVDPADGSWTLLMTVPGLNAVSCVLTGGEHWEQKQPTVGEPS